jgi:hypothetical protein
MKPKNSLLCSNKPVAGQVQSKFMRRKNKYAYYVVLSVQPETPMLPAASHGVTRIHVICVAPSDSNLIKNYIPNMTKN